MVFTVLTFGIADSSAEVYVAVYTDPADFQANQYLTCLTSDLANLLVAEASV